jgi:hypothetical protein
MLFSNPLYHHRRLAKCAGVGTLPQIAFRLGVLCAATFQVGCRRMRMSSVFSWRDRIRRLLRVLFLERMGVLFVHCCFECIAVLLGGLSFRLRM